MSVYNKKAVISGKQVEFYEYEKEVIYGYKDKKRDKTIVGRSSEASEEDKELNREKVFNRARRDLRRLINCNFTDNSKFLTLTFKDADDISTDIKKSNYELKKFIQRLNYYLGYKVKYSCVPEIQEERYKNYGVLVWHYHLVLYNVPQKLDVKKLSDIWGKGFIKVNVIKNVDNVGAYICKYMTKSHKDRLKGEKMYFNSRGLIKPTEIKETNIVEALASSLQYQSCKFEKTFSNDYNTILYKQYIIQDSEKQ